MLHPDPASFATDARQFDFVPVYRRLLSDTLTPVTAFRKLDDGGPACLFESVVGGEKVGRYSFLVARPLSRFSATGTEVTIEKWDADRQDLHQDRNSNGDSGGNSDRNSGHGDGEQRDPAVHRTDDSSSPHRSVQHHDQPLELFRQSFRHTVAHRGAMPPFVGGAIGYAAYDVVRYVENLPDPPPDDRQLPDIDFSFYHDVCVFDHVDKTVWAISLADCRQIESGVVDSDQTDNAITAIYQAATDRVDAMVARLSAPETSGPATSTLANSKSPGSTTNGDDHENPPPFCMDVDSPDDHPAASSIEVTSNLDQPQFESIVRQCVEYIRAGDIFQVVPSQRMAVKSDVDPLEVYRSLRVVNPSPFMFYVRTPACTLVGCSPEIMCRVTDGVMTIRPLAGTRKRGADEQEDRRLEKELLADPKETAEHVMLVDLGRNDVGRVARYGSVELTEIMVIERYSHVMHISSEVRGRLREGLDAFDALSSSLPAGTVSGAPKVRAMQIIDQLEPDRRGPYGGAVGYVDYRGNMDTCLALRTMVHVNGTYYVQAGCGVVADSDPTAEYEETINKAAAMIAAIRMTAARMSRPINEPDEK